MAQQNEPNPPVDPAAAPVKRKRGRPRKEDIPASESSGRTQRRRRNPPPMTGPGLVGQPVSGILDGVFDAGFLITVRVGNGPLLRGMVFDSRLSVPVSAENDVAPHIKMSKRDEIPVPMPTAEPLQKRGPTVLSPNANKGMTNEGSQGSAFRSRDSEAATLGVHSVFKEAIPVTIQFTDDQRQTGESGMASISKGCEGPDTASEPKVGPTIQTHPGNEAAGEPKLGCASQKIPSNEIVGEQKLCSISQTPSGTETAGDKELGSTSQTPIDEATGELTSRTTMVTESAGELKLDSASYMFPSSETIGELEPGSTNQALSVDETVGKPKLDVASDISPQPDGRYIATEEPKLEILNDSDQVKSSAVPAATEALPSQAIPEVLEDTKTNLGGNDDSQMASSDAF